MSNALIYHNGLNQELLEAANVKIYEAHEDLISSQEDSSSEHEDLPVILVCENSFRRGEIKHIEALARYVNCEFRVCCYSHSP